MELFTWISCFIAWTEPFDIRLYEIAEDTSFKVTCRSVSIFRYINLAPQLSAGSFVRQPSRDSLIPQDRHSSCTSGIDLLNTWFATTRLYLILVIICGLRFVFCVAQRSDWCQQFIVLYFLFCLFWFGVCNIRSLFFVLLNFYLCRLVVNTSTADSDLFIVNFVSWMSYPLLILLAVLMCICCHCIKSLVLYFINVLVYSGTSIRPKLSVS
jgi:hypothetical protein